MKKIILLLFIHLTVFSQKQEIEKNIGYFDYKGEECKKEEARYYRTVLKVDNGWLVKEFFINNNLRFEGVFENYKKMKGRKGNFTFYNIQGVKLHIINYESDEKFKYVQVWNSEGQPILTNGNGIKTSKQDNDIQFECFKDSIPIWNKNYRTIQKDTVYNFSNNSIKPKPLDLASFQEELLKFIDFKEFKKSINTPTRIFAKFVIDENGSPKDFKFMKLNQSNGFEFIDSITAFESLFKKWQAGSIQGKQVQFYFTLPLTIEPN